MSLLLILTMPLLFGRCGTDCCTVISLDVTLLVRNQSGQNLLDASNPGHYVEEDIRIYYMKHGQKEEVYDENMDVPDSSGQFYHL